MRFTDAQRDQIVARYNPAVMAAGQSGQQTETVDVAQVHREMVEAGADPSKLTDEQRAELLRRHDRATRQQQPTARGQRGPGRASGGGTPGAGAWRGGRR